MAKYLLHEICLYTCTILQSKTKISRNAVNITILIKGWNYLRRNAVNMTIIVYKCSCTLQISVLATTVAIPPTANRPEASGTTSAKGLTSSLIVHT